MPPNYQSKNSSVARRRCIIFAVVAIMIILTVIFLIANFVGGEPKNLEQSPSFRDKNLELKLVHVVRTTLRQP